MRHECECDHNARNIHFQDTVKLFGDPNAEAGTDERKTYEKYKDIERNVQNAIELLTGRTDMTAQQMKELIDDIEAQLRRYYLIAPDLSRYTTATVNGYYISYPQIVILKQSDYDNLSQQQKLDSKKIYLICEIDTSSDPTLNSEIIFQRSIFISGSARYLDYSNNDSRANIIELYPIRRTGTIFSERDFSILTTLYLATQSFNGDSERAVEQVKNNSDWTTADKNLMDTWEPYLSSLTQFDIDIFTEFQKKYGDITYTTDEDALVVWRDALESIDMIGFWQTLDYNQDGSINTSDATAVLTYSAAKGNGSTDRPEFAVLRKWDSSISREHAVDHKVYDYNGKGTLGAKIATIILRFGAFYGAGMFASTYDGLKAFVERERQGG